MVETGIGLFYIITLIETDNRWRFARDPASPMFLGTFPKWVGI